MANASVVMNKPEAAPMSRMVGPLLLSPSFVVRRRWRANRDGLLNQSGERSKGDNERNRRALWLLAGNTGEHGGDDTITTRTIESKRFRCGRAGSFEHASPPRFLHSLRFVAR